MTPVHAIVAEDEPILAQMLVLALQRLWPELLIAAVVDNGVSAVEEALAQRPDILFLDIKMPGKTGMEAAYELADDWPEGTPFPLIVFVTAYEHFAVEAFEQAAVDYVLKPVNDARLSVTVERLKKRLAQHGERNNELERIIGQLHAVAPTALAPSPSVERLTLIRASVGNKIRLIPIGDVVYFEAIDKYVNVVSTEHESLIRSSLKELLPQLDPDQFWQIHRSTIVNVSRIVAATRDDTGRLSVSLRGRTETLPVGRVFAHLFKQRPGKPH